MKLRYITLLIAIAGFTMPAVQAELLIDSQITMITAVENRDEDDDWVPMTEKQIGEWITKNAAWADKVFDDYLKVEGGKEEVLKEFSEVIFEYEELLKVDRDLAKLFLALLEKESAIDGKLEILDEKMGVVKIKDVLRADVKELIAMQIKLEKAYVELEKKELEEELKDLVEAEEKIDEITEEYLDEIFEDDEEDDD